MVIYHGSEYIIKQPMPDLGRKNNDYGQGFYCTLSEDMAKEWATLRGNDGYANTYEMDMSGLNVIDLLDGEYSILNWLAILLANRTFRTDNNLTRQAKDYILKQFSVSCDDADVIIGYRADDSYFSYAMDFLNNGLSVSNLEKAMRLGKLGEQIFIKSPQAFERLKYMGSNIALKNEYYPKWLNRDNTARSSYFAMDSDLEGTFIMDILRESWRDGDERIQRIVR